MKGFKSMLCALVALATLCLPAAAEEGVARGEAVDRLVRALYEGLPLEEVYCQHENTSAHYTGDAASYPVLCALYGQVPPCGFSDVTAQHGDAISISLAAAMGVVNGYPDGTFCPDRLLTWDEAVKLCICARQVAGSPGEHTYPESYWERATGVALIKDRPQDTTAPISDADFEALLQKTLAFKREAGNVMLVFTEPADQKACAEAYATAVADRCGALQSALLSDALREQTRADFESGFWVTGVSSPWVESWEVTQMSQNTFDVLFHYATSTGAGPDILQTLYIEQENGVCRIVAIEPQQ